MDDRSYTIRIPRRWLRVAMIAVVTAMIVAPLTAIAADKFNDVPNGNTFHDDISWMADAGVTKGCNPPTNSQYCPNDNVSRGQMAAFMRRFAQFLGVEDGPAAVQGSLAGTSVTGATPAADTPTRLATINNFNVPAPGGAILVVADTAMLSTNVDIGLLWIEVDGSGTCDGAVTTYAWTDVMGPFNSLSTSASADLGAGNHRIDLCALSDAGFTAFGAGALNVEWVESTQIGTVLANSDGVSANELMDQIRNSSFGE